MNKGIQTIRFMVIVSVAFIAVLATVNEVTRARIERNFEIERAKSILYAFNIFPEGMTDADLSATTTTADIPWPEGAVLEAMETQIRQTTAPIPNEFQEDIRGSFLDGQNTITVYKRVNEDGETMAYGFPLYGKGLWGTIEGFAVVSADLQKMEGLDFTKQSETPGLGARITEQEYKLFFRNLDLSGFYEAELPQTPVVMVRDKDTSNIENSTNSVQAITGATQTSQGVLDMVNSNLDLYLSILKANS